MCGIAGITGDRDRKEAAATVRRMTDALAHRGPDAEGIHTWDETCFGHRRLAIFDLSDLGRQPMLSPDGTVGVVFNGAIYNFRALRRELEQHGYTFRSQTDTEVLIHGYVHWGIDGLVSRIEGMFAFAVWDERSSTMYLVRDRLGVKPLVYAQRGRSLAFASTVTALREAGFAGGLDRQAIVEFLEFGYVTDSRTIYEGLAKVAAASIVEFRQGKLSSRSYWSPPAVSNHSISFEDAVSETERLFLRAVELRLQADVRIGALLSGGIDSSLVCWAISKLGGDITSFTIGTPGDAQDESHSAIQTARELKIRHKVLPVHPEDAPKVSHLVCAYGEPFACGSALGMMAASKAVRQEATVLLTGDGGDDVYLGYPEHLHFHMAQRVAAHLPPVAGQVWETLRAGVPKKGVLRRMRHFLDYATHGMGAVTRAHDGLPFYQSRKLLGERLSDARLPVREIPGNHESARTLLEQFLDSDRKNRFVAEYLTKVDGSTMFYALEARSPFLDHQLWSFAATLPFHIRLKDGRLKAVLRELARRHIGPRIASGRKQGFHVPVYRWLAGKWKDAARESFENSLLVRDGWVRSGSVSAELDKAAASGIAPKQLWYLYVLESWLQKNQPSSISAPALIS